MGVETNRHSELCLRSLIASISVSGVIKKALKIEIGQIEPKLKNKSSNCTRQQKLQWLTEEEVLQQ